MELMRGKFFIGQLVLFFFAFLFLLIAYGAGVWWSVENDRVTVFLTLWSICSHFGDNEGCVSLSGTDYMKPVILTSQACGGIVIVLLMPLLVLMLLLAYKLRTGIPEDDTFLYPRTALLFLTELFLLITVAHSQNCPPEFKFGAIRMRQQLGWGWDLALTSLFFLFIPCVVHFVESGRMYRSNSLKK